MTDPRTLHPSMFVRTCPAGNSCRKPEGHDGPCVGSYQLDDLERDERGEA